MYNNYLLLPLNKDKIYSKTNYSNNCSKYNLMNLPFKKQNYTAPQNDNTQSWFSNTEWLTFSFSCLMFHTVEKK